MYNYHKHITFKQIRKFILLIALIVCYTGYLSIEYDFKTAGLASLLTWSFFVLCTPVADAGLLLDLPLRLLFGIRMIVAEAFVWVVAIMVNIIFTTLLPHYYKTTGLTQVFYNILTTPYPYWIIIVLSGVGTFLSVFFGDEVLDLICKRNFKEFFSSKKHVYAAMVLVVTFIIIISLYYHCYANLLEA